MNKNDIKKELMLGKAPARFSHYCAGNLYYTVVLVEGKFQFPVPTVESVFDQDADTERTILSPDLGTTTFEKQMPGALLIRWISKAVDSGDFVKIDQEE